MSQMLGQENHQVKLSELRVCVCVCVCVCVPIQYASVTKWNMRMMCAKS